jgi:hypothetical protein
MIQKLACALTFLLCLSATAADKVDFTKDLMPLFKDRCIKCHGHIKESGKVVTKGDLDLTKPETIKETFKPGHPEKSDLYKLTITDDEDDFMPPKGDRLTAAQKKLIFDWIKQGGSFAGYTRKAQGMSLMQKLAKSVKPAAMSTLKHFEMQGALVLPLAQKSPLLQINFKPVANKTNAQSLTKLIEVKDQLLWLNLSRSKIDDSALATVGKLTNLTRLHLDNTSISDAGLKHLPSLKNLEYLNLYNTQVTDAGIKSLASLKSLKKLYLWQSKVTPKGAAALKKLLPNTFIHSHTPKITAKVIPKSEPKGKGKPTASPFDKNSCCDKAHAKGKKCTHPCCKKALAAKGICKKCNPKKGKK